MTRDEAAAFILAGKAQGRCDQARDDFGYIDQLWNLHKAEGMPINAETLGAVLDFLRPRIQKLDAAAEEAQAAVDRLIADLEHPGARLARRVVMTWRAAREAWRAAR